MPGGSSKRSNSVKARGILTEVWKRTQSQFDAVESAPCFARERVGKVSPIRIQIPAANQISSAQEKGSMKKSLTGPSTRISKDEQARRNNHERPDSLMILRMLRGPGSSKHKQPHALPYTADDERQTTTKPFHHI